MRTCNTLAPQLGTGHPVPLADTPAGLSDHSKHPLSSRAWLEVLHRDGIHLAWGAPVQNSPAARLSNVRPSTFWVKGHFLAEFS